MTKYQYSAQWFFLLGILFHTFLFQNGHAGFMLSCYDAQLCYDSRSDTFLARYVEKLTPSKLRLDTKLLVYVYMPYYSCG